MCLGNANQNILWNAVCPKISRLERCRTRPEGYQVLCVSSGCSIAIPRENGSPNNNLTLLSEIFVVQLTTPVVITYFYQLGTPRDEQVLFSGARYIVVPRELAAVMSTSTAAGGEADRPELPVGRLHYRPPLFTWSSMMLAFFAWAGCRPLMPCFPSERLAVSVHSR